MTIVFLLKILCHKPVKRAWSKTAPVFKLRDFGKEKEQRQCSLGESVMLKLLSSYVGSGCSVATDNTGCK